MSIIIRYWRAKEVRDKLLEVLPKYKQFEGLDISVGCFQNGREQGFIFTVFDSVDRTPYSVAFAEHRISDEIVIYQGEGLWMRTEDVNWEGARYYYNVDGAVLEIVSALSNAIDPTIRR